MSDAINPVHGGNIYAAQRRYGGDWKEFLDFSANINPLGISSAVNNAMLESLERVVNYPDPEAWELCQAIAATYGVDQNNVLLGNGAVELIFQVCRTLRPSRMLLPSPTFLEYSLAAAVEGIPVVHIPMEISGQSAVMPLEAICVKLQAGDMVFLCNPNNPTGSVHAAKDIESLAARARDVGAWLVIDESFIDFRPVEAAESCRKLVHIYPGLIILHSLTKFLAIPGLRLGFLIATAAVIKKFAHSSIPWNINVMAQAAGVAGLSDEAFRRLTVSYIQQEKDRFATQLTKLRGVSVFWPAVNFVLLDIRHTGRSVSEVQATLWSRRVMVRNCSNFEGLSEHHMRLAVRKADENDRFIKILWEILGKEGEV